jgi:hypothetical protein
MRYFSKTWGSALNSALLGYFKSLRGIQLSIALFQTDIPLLDQDVMRDAGWKKMKLPEVVRHFNSIN